MEREKAGVGRLACQVATVKFSLSQASAVTVTASGAGHCHCPWPASGLSSPKT